RLASISPAEQRSGRARRARAMAHALLVLFRELAERPAERRIHEHRVVAEPAASARREGDLAVDDALDRLLAAGLVDERDDTPKVGTSPTRRHRAQPREEQRDAARVVETGPAESRGVETGPAVERVHLEAGIVAERRVAGLT